MGFKFTKSFEKKTPRTLALRHMLAGDVIRSANRYEPMHTARIGQELYS